MIIFGYWFGWRIGGNGSYVEGHGVVVMHQLIIYEQCRRIVDWLHSRKLEFYLKSNNGLFASEHFEEKAEGTIQEYTRRKGRSDADKMTVRKAFPEMIFGGKLYRDDLNKISYVLNSYEDYIETKKQFPDMQNGTWAQGNGFVWRWGVIFQCFPIASMELPWEMAEQKLKPWQIM